MILASDVDHFPFSVDSTRARDAVKGWLDLYFPV
jgi:hypothetical protein